MKRITLILLAIISIVVFYLGTLFFLSGDVMVEDHYSTYQEAKHDNLFMRGWLPDILPETTINIRTANNVDLNHSTGNFTIPEKEMDKFKSKITKVDERVFYYTENKGGKKWIFTINNDNGHVRYKFE